MPTPFVLDEFVDTAGINLSAHTPDIGGAWIQQFAGICEFITSPTNGIQFRVGSSSAAVYTNAATPFSPDYDVYLLNILTNPVAGASLAAIARYIDNDNYYVAYYIYDAFGCFIFKVFGGVATNLGSVSVSIGSNYNMKFSVVGSTLNLYIDTGSGYTLVLTVSDSDLTAAGKVGLVMTTDNSGYIDRFQAEGDAPPPPGGGFGQLLSNKRNRLIRNRQFKFQSLKEY